MISISCLETKLLNNNNWYGRFQLAPFRKGEGLTVANALRRTLLAEKSNFYISWVDFYNAEIPYSVLTGMRESVFDILLNLKQIIFTSNIIMPSSPRPLLSKKKHVTLDVLNKPSPGGTIFSDSQVLDFKSKEKSNMLRFDTIKNSVLLNSRAWPGAKYKKHKANISRGYSWYKTPYSGNLNSPWASSKLKAVAWNLYTKNSTLNLGEAMGPINDSFGISYDDSKNAMFSSTASGRHKRSRNLAFERLRNHFTRNGFQSNTNELNEVPEFIKNSDYYQMNDSMNSKAKHSLPYIGYICVKGPGIIYAKHIKLPTGLKCVDPDKYIVTLADDGLFYLRFAVVVKKNDTCLLIDSINSNSNFKTPAGYLFQSNRLDFNLNSFSSHISSLKNMPVFKNGVEEKFLPGSIYNMQCSSIKKYYEHLNNFSICSGSSEKLKYAKTNYFQKTTNLSNQLTNKLYNLNDNWHSQKLQMSKLATVDNNSNNNNNNQFWPSILNRSPFPTLSNNLLKPTHYQTISILANLKKTCLLNIQIKHYYYKCGRFDRFLFDFLKPFKPSLKSNYKMTQQIDGDKLFFNKSIQDNLNTHDKSSLCQNKGRRLELKMIRLKYAKQNRQKGCFSYFRSCQKIFQTDFYNSKELNSNYSFAIGNELNKNSPFRCYIPYSNYSSTRLKLFCFENSINEKFRDRVWPFTTLDQKLNPLNLFNCSQELISIELENLKFLKYFSTRLLLSGETINSFGYNFPIIYPLQKTDYCFAPFSNHLLESDYGYQIKKYSDAFPSSPRTSVSSNSLTKNFSQVFCPMHKKIFKNQWLFFSSPEKNRQLTRKTLYHKKTICKPNENEELKNNIWSFFNPEIKSQSINLRDIFLQKIPAYNNLFINSKNSPGASIFNLKSPLFKNSPQSSIAAPRELNLDSNKRQWPVSYSKRYNRSYFLDGNWKDVYYNSYSGLKATQIQPIPTNSLSLKPFYLNVEYVLYILKQSTKYFKNQRFNSDARGLFFDLTQPYLSESNKYLKFFSSVMNSHTLSLNFLEKSNLLDKLKTKSILSFLITANKNNISGSLQTNQAKKKNLSNHGSKFLWRGRQSLPIRKYLKNSTRASIYGFLILGNHSETFFLDSFPSKIIQNIHYYSNKNISTIYPQILFKKHPFNYILTPIYWNEKQFKQVFSIFKSAPFIKPTKPISLYNKKSILKKPTQFFSCRMTKSKMEKCRQLFKTKNQIMRCSLKKKSDHPRYKIYSFKQASNCNMIVANTNNYVNRLNLSAISRRILNFKINHNRLQVEPFNINIYNSKIRYTLRYTYPFKYTIFETFLQLLFKPSVPSFYTANLNSPRASNKDANLSKSNRWLLSRMLKLRAWPGAKQTEKWDNILYNESFKIYTNLSNVNTLLPWNDNLKKYPQLFTENQKELSPTTILDNSNTTEINPPDGALINSSLKLKQQAQASKGAYPAFITKSNFDFPVKFDQKVKPLTHSIKTATDYIQLWKESLSNNRLEKYDARGLFNSPIKSRNFTYNSFIPSCFTLERCHYFTFPKSWFIHNYIPKELKVISIHNKAYAKTFVETKHFLSFLRLLPFTFSVWNLASIRQNPNSAISNGFFKVEPWFKKLDNQFNSISKDSSIEIVDDSSKFALPQSNNVWPISSPVSSLLVNAATNYKKQSKRVPNKNSSGRALINNSWKDKIQNSFSICKFANHSKTKILLTLKKSYKWRITNIVNLNDAFITIPVKESFEENPKTLRKKENNLQATRCNKVKKLTAFPSQTTTLFKKSLDSKLWLRRYFFNNDSIVKPLNIYVTTLLLPLKNYKTLKPKLFNSLNQQSNENLYNDHKNFLFSQNTNISKTNTIKYQNKWINKTTENISNSLPDAQRLNFENIYYKNVLYNSKKITVRLLTNKLFPLVVYRKFSNVTSISNHNKDNGFMTPEGYFQIQDLKNFPHYIASFTNLYKDSKNSPRASDTNSLYTDFLKEQEQDSFEPWENKKFFSRDKNRFVNLENNETSIGQPNVFSPRSLPFFPRSFPLVDIFRSMEYGENRPLSYKSTKENQRFVNSSSIKNFKAVAWKYNVNFYSTIKRSKIPPGNLINYLQTATLIKKEKSAANIEANNNKVVEIKRHVKYRSGVFNFIVSSNVQHDSNFFTYGSSENSNSSSRYMQKNKKHTYFQLGNNSDQKFNDTNRINLWSSTFFCNYSSYAISMESDLFLQNLISRDLKKREYFLNSSPINEKNPTDYSLRPLSENNFQNFSPNNNFQNSEKDYNSDLMTTATPNSYLNSRSRYTHNISYLWRKTAHLAFLQTCKCKYNTNISSKIEVRQNWYNLHIARLGPYISKNRETFYKFPVSIFSEFLCSSGPTQNNDSSTKKPIYIALVPGHGLKKLSKKPHIFKIINSHTNTYRQSQCSIVSFIDFYPKFFYALAGKYFYVPRFFTFFRHEQYHSNQLFSFCGKKCWQHPIIHDSKIQILDAWGLNFDSITYFIWLIFYSLLTKRKFPNSTKMQCWFPTLAYTLLSSTTGEIYNDLLRRGLEDLIDKEVYQTIYHPATNDIIDTKKDLLVGHQKNQLSTLRPWPGTNHNNYYVPSSPNIDKSNQMVSYFTIKENTLAGHHIYKVNYIVESHFLEYAATPHELIHFQQNQSLVKNSHLTTDDNEYIQIDIWTNGELSPRRALLNAFKKLFELFYNLSKYNFLKPIEI